jgi:L-ascorbate metabolism protein UlaG (beta-lactamase superfamily)
MTTRITHIGGPTVLLEIDGWRLLTDPTFDPPGRRYGFGWGSNSCKLTGPAIAAADLGPIDAVLLSHDHHSDNLDTTGRALLPSAGAVLTTASGARRLGGNARGLAPWATTQLEAPGRPTIQVTATPCRHGPPLSRPIAGDVIGFALGWDDQATGPCESPAIPCCTTAFARSPTASKSTPPCSILDACASRSPGQCATA